MYTSVGFVPCNGQHISYQHSNGYRVITSEYNENNITNKRMERKELTLSFHNLIKRGIVKCSPFEFYFVFLNECSVAFHSEC